MTIAPAKPADEPVAAKVASAADLVQLAQNYQVPMSDGTVKEIAGEGASPEKAAALEQYLKTSAAGLYPTLAAQINAGIPTAHLLDPYRQVGKSVLGEDYEPDFIGNPRDSQALTGGFDPQTKRPAPMSLDQWKSTLMTDLRFRYDLTPHAIAAAQYAVQQLHEHMTNGTPNE